MIVVDTSVILAYMNSGDTYHESVCQWLDQEHVELITTPLIVAEADYLVSSLGGARAASAFRADLAIGAWLVEWWAGAIRTAVEIADRYLGLADASLVALAERVETVDIATLDERHFRTLAPQSGGTSFRLLPMDR